MPALLFCGVSPLQALGTNKLQSMFGTGTALRNYWRSGLVEWRPNRLSVLLVFAGAVAGAFVVQRIETGLLNLIIPMLLVAAAIYILLVAAHDRRGRAPARSVERATPRSAARSVSTTASSAPAPAPSSPPAWSPCAATA